jgi:hypothetical protein
VVGEGRDFDQQIAWTRIRPRQIDFIQGFGILDGKSTLTVDDGFHGDLGVLSVTR